MVDDHELLTLVLGFGVLCLALYKRRALAAIPGIRLFAAAYLFYLSAWLCALLETLYYPRIYNLLEHAAASIGSAFLLLWCWRSLVRPEIPE